ncbi:MAG: hypothetical protein NC035_08330 [Bacteroides sp.]|nr:hypothetical protein [Bacteroides sp.]
MTSYQFELCKKDFLATYGDMLCEESYSLIDKAGTPSDFINLLHTFAVYLRYKVIPSAEWSRKWFIKELPLINSCGVYLDQIAAVKDPDSSSLVLIGNCSLNVMYTRPIKNNITLQDESNVKLIMYGAACCTVREKGTGKTTIINCNKPAQVKIHKI